jgi:hypothetical protein
VNLPYGQVEVEYYGLAPDSAREGAGGVTVTEKPSYFREHMGRRKDANVGLYVTGVSSAALGLVTAIVGGVILAAGARGAARDSPADTMTAGAVVMATGLVVFGGGLLMTSLAGRPGQAGSYVQWVPREGM